MRSDQTAKEELQKHLEATERLLGAGRPRLSPMLRVMGAFLIPFSFVFCGFVLYWGYLLLSTDTPNIFLRVIFYSMFLGVLFVFGRFLADGLAKKRTLYGITSTRVIIRSGIIRTNLESLPLGSLTDLTLTEGQDGRGAIALGSRFPRNSLRPAFGLLLFGFTFLTNLEDISDARTVFRVLQDAQKSV